LLIILSLQVFSSKSDVWSYGVTVWEVFNNAQLPYGPYTTPDARNFIARGEKLGCPRKFYK
jgi:hypothetical protein